MRLILSATDTYNFPLLNGSTRNWSPCPLISVQSLILLISQTKFTSWRSTRVKSWFRMMSRRYLRTCLWTKTIEILVNRAFSNNWFNTTRNLTLTRTDLVDLLSVATKGQLFQFDGALYEQTDGVAMGSTFGPLLTNVFMSSTLERQGKLPSFYRWYVDVTVMPDLATATTFPHTLNRVPTRWLNSPWRWKGTASFLSLAPNYSTMYLRLKPRFMWNQQTRVCYYTTKAM